MENFGGERVGAQKENEFRKEKKETRGGGQPLSSIFAMFFLKKSPISENIGYIFLNPTYISPIRE